MVTGCLSTIKVAIFVARDYSDSMYHMKSMRLCLADHMGNMELCLCVTCEISPVSFFASSICLSRMERPRTVAPVCLIASMSMVDKSLKKYCIFAPAAGYILVVPRIGCSLLRNRISPIRILPELIKWRCLD